VKPRVIAVGASGLGPHVAGLRELERDLRYPLAADSFVIDHGREYHPFFSGLGDARFVVARERSRVVGSLAVVARDALSSGRRVRTLYFADYKIAPEHRGTGLGRRLAARATWEVLGRGWFQAGYAYLAAMQGARGDVTRTARGATALRLFRPLAVLDLYFESRARLAALPEGGPPPPASPGLDLSPGVGRAPVVTTGRKDFVLASTGRPWPLVHLPASPARWRPSLGAYLRQQSSSLGHDAVACFAVDRRLREHRGWLVSSGLVAGATCTVHAVSLPPWREAPPWVHLATSEI
jgi:GNAT superfamily N-acetyltransferase